jgi:transcriptional regulator with XRE-family HTH domain
MDENFISLSVLQPVAEMEGRWARWVQDRLIQLNAKAAKSGNKVPQTEIARQIDWDQGQVSKYLNRKGGGMDFDKLAAWAALYGLTLAEFFSEATPEPDEVRTLYSSLSATGQQLVLQMMRDWPKDARPSGSDRASWLRGALSGEESRETPPAASGRRGSRKSRKR